MSAIKANLSANNNLSMTSNQLIKLFDMGAAGGEPSTATI
jgi:hypothetical protein